MGQLFPAGDDMPAFEMYGGMAEIAATVQGILMLEAQENGYTSDYMVLDICNEAFASFDVKDGDDNDRVGYLNISAVD